MYFYALLEASRNKIFHLRELFFHDYCTLQLWIVCLSNIHNLPTMHSLRCMRQKESGVTSREDHSSRLHLF